MTCTPKEPASLPGAGGAGKRSVCGGLAALPSLGIHHRPFPIIDFLCSVGGGGTSHPLQIIGRINVNGKSNLRLFLNDGRKRNNRVRTYIYAGKTSYQNWVKSRQIRIAYNFRQYQHHTPPQFNFCRTWIGNFRYQNLTVIYHGQVLPVHLFRFPRIHHFVE